MHTAKFKILGLGPKSFCTGILYF